MEGGEYRHFIVPCSQCLSAVPGRREPPCAGKALFSYFLPPPVFFLRSAASAFLPRAALAIENKTDQKGQ